MLDILLNNYLLLINLSIPFMLGLYFVIFKHEYSIKEFLIQSLLTTFILITAFWLGYRVSDIYTKSYKTTNIQKFVFEEAWTERVVYTETYPCGKNTCSRIKTRYVYHPDKYYIETDFGSFIDNSISKDDYFHAKSDFGETKSLYFHTNQSSFGDGRTYEVYPTKNIPFTDYDSEINYIYASKTNIIKSNKYEELESLYKNELREYPEIKKDDLNYGTRNFNRVINSHLISGVTSEKLQFQLEQLSINFPGNPIIYLTTSTDRAFSYVIKGHYKDMYFNDIMLVVGINKENEKIIWTDIVSVVDNAELKVFGSDISSDFQTLVSKFSNIIKQHWKKPGMENFSYLSGDIDLPLWYQLLIVTVNIIGSFTVFRFFFKHQI